MTAVLRETTAGAPVQPGSSARVILLTDCFCEGRAIVAVKRGSLDAGKLLVTHDLLDAEVFGSPAAARKFIRGLLSEQLHGWTPTIVPY